VATTNREERSPSHEIPKTISTNQISAACQCEMTDTRVMTYKFLTGSGTGPLYKYIRYEILNNVGAVTEVNVPHDDHDDNGDTPVQVRDEPHDPGGDGGQGKIKDHDDDGTCRDDANGIYLADQSHLSLTAAKVGMEDEEQHMPTREEAEVGTESYANNDDAAAETDAFVEVGGIRSAPPDVVKQPKGECDPESPLPCQCPTRTFTEPPDTIPMPATENNIQVQVRGL
jgi:hypothetical protein